MQVEDLVAKKISSGLLESLKVVIQSLNIIKSHSNNDLTFSKVLH